jgi:hypothetical protein
VVWGAGARGESAAASGTLPMGGLFGAVLSTPVGALIVSCAGSFCADAEPTLTRNATAASNVDCFIMVTRLPWVPLQNARGSCWFLGWAGCPRVGAKPHERTKLSRRKSRVEAESKSQHEDIRELSKPSPANDSKEEMKSLTDDPDTDGGG